MIVLVDMEHQRARQARLAHGKGTEHACSVPREYLREVQRRLEVIAQDRCVLRTYTDVTQESLRRDGARALILSGNVTEWDAYPQEALRPLMDVVLSASLPILGLCGGLQFIAMAHGATVGPMRALEKGEEDVTDRLGAGYLKEWGFTRVRVVHLDPLFEGLSAPVFLEAHYWEVKDIPEGFELLATTETCRVQVLRRTGTLVYGTQFHPEAYTAEPCRRSNWLVDLVYPAGYEERQLDGRRLLANFLGAVRAAPQ